MIYDPTSGFVRGEPQSALAVFARSFPLTYPEIEALVVLQRKRFRFHQRSPASCIPGAPAAGLPSRRTSTSLKYMLHVLLGVFVNILKIDPVAKSARK